MKTALIAAAASVALLAGGFYAGYETRDRLGPSRGEIEDYALSNILSDLAYAGHLRRAQYDELRGLIDVNLNGHLTRARRYSGAIADAEFSLARTKILARVANLWDTTPPFRTEDFAKSKGQAWYAEWQRSFVANMALLHEAQVKCERIQCNGAQLGAPADAPAAARR